MRRILTILTLAVMSAPVLADTFIAEKATVNPLDTAELEIRPSYRKDKFKGTGNIGYTDTTMRVDLRGRWVPVENWEARAVIPWVGDKFEGGGSSDSDSGLSQMILGGKYGFTPAKALSLAIELPTGNQNKLLGEGTNVDVAFAAEKQFTQSRGLINVGYVMKTEFKTNFDGDGAKVKVNPGDVIYLTGGLTKTRNEVDYTGEFYLGMVGKAKQASTSVSGTNGTVINLGFNAAKNLDNDWRIKGGLSLGIGEEEVSSFDLNRPAGDWRLTFGASYLFDLNTGAAPRRHTTARPVARPTAAPAQTPAAKPASQAPAAKPTKSAPAKGR